jgi:uncharacterized RDD family membrane protein YckC
VSNEHGLVTPEAVRLELPEATVGTRGIALLVDWIAQALIIGILYFGTMLWIENPLLPEWAPLTVMLTLTFLVVFGYPIGFETVWRGRTPGKQLLGLRVVTVEGAPVTFRHAAIRAALGLVDFGGTSGLAAVISSLVSKRNQRLGDFVAGTVVLRERSGAPPATASRFEMPPIAMPIAEGLDVSGLTHRDYAAIRAYLLRVPTLLPQRRYDVGKQLVDALMPRLGAVPAHNLPPDVFLQTVAARYQRQSHTQHDTTTSG